MRKRFIALLGLVVGASANAQRPPLSLPKDATILFDARIREFRCWSDGPLTVERRRAPCDAAAGWHPVTGALYFTRGQLLTILVTHGVANDIFSVDVSAEDLAAPATPVSGSISELPKLQPIPALATLFTGTGVTKLVAGCPSHSPIELLRAAPTVANKDFAGNLESWFVAPLTAKEVVDLISADYTAAITTIANAGGYLSIASAIQTSINRLATPTTFETWASTTKDLAMEIDRASALRTRIVASGLPAAAKTISDAANIARAKSVSCASSIDLKTFAPFAAKLQLAFADRPYTHIQNIGVAASHFTSDYPALKELLTQIELAMAPAVPAKTQLPTLKANLTTLVDSVSAIQSANDRRAALETVLTVLTGARAMLDNQAQAYVPLTDSLAAKAASIDSVGNTLALPAPYDLLPVGEWFANKTISITLKQGTRLKQFDVGAVSDATRLVIGGDQPPAKATTTAVADLSVTRTIRFPVYDTYHVQLGLGFVYSSVRDDRFQIDQVTVGKGDAAVTQQFIDQTRARNHTLLATANVVVFPFPRNDFPWKARYPGEPKPPFYEDLGVMAGFGIANPARDVLLGMVWRRPTSPIGLQVAWHIAFRDYPPTNLDITKPLPDTTRVFTLPQRTINGVAGGIVFTTDFFTKIFATIFKAGS